MRTPTFPKTNSLTGRALMRLLIGQQFTHRDFDSNTSSYRLSGYIENLRNYHHWPIETITETAPTRDKTGRVAKYGRYLIEPEMMAEIKKMVGDRLPAFIKAVQDFENGEKV
jgi:hypothetical protein